MQIRIVIDFDDTEQRDRYLHEDFPERKATDTPGLYEVDNGRVGVHLLTVTLYLAELPEFLRDIEEKGGSHGTAKSG